MYRAEFKKKQSKSDRDRRREALETSRSADRARLFAELRELAETETQKRPKTSGLVRKLMYPDFMVSIPERLQAEWLVQVRPAGRRVIATIREGRLTIRSAKNGNFMAEFPASEALMRLGRLTVLDGVLDEHGNFFIMDVLLWDAAEISECEAECRHFWLTSRFSELDQSEMPTGKIKNFRYIQPLDATSENIASAYAADRKFFQPQFPTIPLQTDSLLFIHKSATYLPGLSPLYLQWRDGKICKFPIDTADSSGLLIPRRQAVVLKAKRRGSRVALKTWDSVTLAELDEMSQFPLSFGLDESSFLIRGYIDEFIEESEASPFQLVNLADLERVSAGRVFPDSLARIRTQAHFRKHGQPLVTIDRLTSSL